MSRVGRVTTAQRGVSPHPDRQGRNVGFSIGHQIDGRVRDALACGGDEDWVPARDGNGAARDGAQVVEITDFIDLAAWPAGTRMIVRCE